MENIGDFEYSKKDLIGHGAFAVVFKGRFKKKPEHVVAIKCITKKNLAKSQNLLSKEIKILKELSGLKHDNVVALLDCKETSHHVYLVMEYCNGGDLADYLQAKGTLSEDTISSFLRQIAGAMKALNAKGIVHRDLKPQNILLAHPPKKESTSTSQINLKIADFGFARFLQDGVMAATLCGSPMYMAPEVIMSIQYDAKADLWSVGTIVYQCLTGKAPFQAQTPQQLKMFYERNSNLVPNIPPGTSKELRDLLLKLLKRNARDRIEFDDFFKHPFLYPPVKSAPVPVPIRRRSQVSLSESPPMKAVSASPLSERVFASPPRGLPPKQRPPPPQPPQMKESDSFHDAVDAKTPEEAAAPKPSRPKTPEDFVMVPDNLPSDHSAGGSGEAAAPKPSAVDLNAIFSNKTPPSVPPIVEKIPVEPSPQQTSPNRPSTLPGVQSPGKKPGSTQPIPVPSQVKAYEQIQRSIAKSPSSPLIEKTPSIESPQTGIPIPSRKSSVGSGPCVGSISPPSIQFSIGTPPTSAWKRNSPGGQVVPCGSSSPNRRPQLHRIATLPGAFPTVGSLPSCTPLPTILGSPTKAPLDNPFLAPASSPKDSPLSPIVAPFGIATRGRAMTCPDNMGVSAEDVVDNTRKSTRTVATSPLQIQSSANNNNIMMAYSPPAPTFRPAVSNTSLHDMTDGSNAAPQQADEPVGRERRYSSCCDESPNHSLPFTQSPPNMEGPVLFIAPELAEETLMDKGHNDTMAKLNYILALVECLIELAQSRSSPLSESITNLSSSRTHYFGGNNVYALDHLAFLSESQRRVEQLVLYMHALQLLSSSLELGKGEIKEGRLQPSNGVRNILGEMNHYYQQCLAVCRNLHNQGLSINPEVSTVTASELIYSYAIETCQTAALDELFGNPDDCFHRYRNAHILLHSLSQQANSQKDKELLNKFRMAVEKRLYSIQSQQVVFTLETGNNQ